MLDAHCHLSDVSREQDINEALKSASARGINGWLSCALNKEEVRWHQTNRFDNVRFAAGIHPYYDKGTSLTLEELANLAANKQIFAIGEIGLDKRSSNLPKQIKIFKDQLAIAREYSLPVIFHMVGHTDVFFKILDEIPVNGIWHGFSGSGATVKQFSRFNLTFSIGSALIQSLKHDVIQAIYQYGNFLFETDAPYNLKKAEDNSVDKLNPLIELVSYIKTAAKLIGVNHDALQQSILITEKTYLI